MLQHAMQQISIRIVFCIYYVPRMNFTTIETQRSDWFIFGVELRSISLSTGSLLSVIFLLRSLIKFDIVNNVVKFL
jgi:hypothetical protein